MTIPILLPVDYTGIITRNPDRLIKASFRGVKDFVNVFIRIYIYIYIFACHIACLIIFEIRLWKVDQSAETTPNEMNVSNLNPHLPSCVNLSKKKKKKKIHNYYYQNCIHPFKK